MPYTLVRHKSQDFAKWKSVFEEQAPARRAASCKSIRLFRTTTDPNEIVILLEWGDMNKARQYYQSPNLRDAMQRGGIIDQPDVYTIEEVEHKGA